MTDRVYNIQDIDYKDFTFDNIRESRGGSFIAGIKDLRYISLDKHVSKEGFSISNKNCYIDIELDNKLFLEFLNNTDDFCKQGILDNSQEWLSHNLNRTQVNDFYESIVSFRKKFNKEPYLRLKIPLSKQTISIRIKDEDGDDIDSDRLPKDEIIFSGIIEIKGIKFLKQEVVCDMELASMIIHNSQPKLNITGLLKKNMKRSKDTDELDKDVSRATEKNHKEKRVQSSDETKLKDNLEKERSKKKQEKLKKEKEDKLKEIRMEKEEHLSRISKIQDQQKREVDILKREQEELELLKKKREMIEEQDRVRREKEEAERERLRKEQEEERLRKEQEEERLRKEQEEERLRKEQEEERLRKEQEEQMEGEKADNNESLVLEDNSMLNMTEETYSIIDAREELKDKVIKDELTERLKREKDKAQDIFKVAHDLMEKYEEKREEAMRQVEIVNEIESELKNLE